MDLENTNTSAKLKASATESGINGSGSQNQQLSLHDDTAAAGARATAFQYQDDTNETALGVATVMPTLATTVLDLPPPSANLLEQGNVTFSDSTKLPTDGESKVKPSTQESTASIETEIYTSECTSASASACPVSVSMGPSASDFDSDTELSIVAAAAVAAVASTGMDLRSPSSSTTGSILASGGAVPLASTEIGSGLGAGTVNTNGYNANNSTSSSAHLSLNAKQQRQQKRRRERAQRLQAERDSRCSSSTLNGTYIAGSMGISGCSAVSLNVTVAGAAGQGIGVITTGASSSALIGSGPGAGPGNGMIYHINSAGSMGEDSNNSNGNFTSSSNGSNNLLPPTDSIASLLLNPPHSPECNSGLMATPSDSEGESLDEDLLSTSSSSTLLLPRDKPPPRPPPPVRRKLPRSPVLEEEIIDGFAILEFKTYEDLEFAIKLGQKRKEKRLSALEELTSTYCIEEMKIPKIIDTGQPHPLRATSLSTLTVVSNTNLKENTQLHHRNAVVINNNINHNCTTSNNKINSSCSAVYMLPSASTVSDTQAECVAHWRSEYGQQQDQMHCGNSVNIKSNISNENQISNSCSQQVNHAKQSDKQLDDAGTVASLTNSTTNFLENGNDALMLDISCSTLTDAINENTKDCMKMSMISANCKIDGNKSHNPPASINNTDELTSNVVTSVDVHNNSMEYIGKKSIKSNDATAVGTPNNHKSVCKISQPTKAIEKSNHSKDLEVPTSAACHTLNIQDLTNGSAQVVVPTNNNKKDNEQNDIFIEAPRCSSKGDNNCDNVCGENKNSASLVGIDYPSAAMHVSNSLPKQDRKSHSKPSDLSLLKIIGSAVPSTPTLMPGSSGGTESDARDINNENTIASTQVVAVITGASVSTSAVVLADSGSKECNAIHKCVQEKPRYPIMCVAPSISRPQHPNAGTSVRNDTSVTASSNNDQPILFATKISSNGLPSAGQRPLVPLLPCSQKTHGGLGLGCQFSARISTSSSGLPISSPSSSVVPANNLKSNDTVTRTISHNNVTASGTGLLSSLSAASVETLKITNGSTPTSSNSVVNGFVGDFPTINSTAKTLISTQPRVSPHVTTKLMSAVSTTTSISKSTVGNSGSVFGAGASALGTTGPPLLFPGVPPPPMSHVAAGMPMLIQAPPYRTPYPNYSLYTPYNNITHGPYLPPTLQTASPNISSPLRSSDTRSSRESPIVPASLKAASLSFTVQQSVSSTPAMRPITPLNNISVSQPVSQSVATTASFLSANSTAVHSLSHLHVSHSHHLPVYASNSFGNATAALITTTSVPSTPAVTSLATATPQALPPPSTQMLPQAGQFPSVSHLLTTHPQLAAPMQSQHQQFVRCGGTPYTSTVPASNLSASVLTVQSLPTTSCSSSVSASSSSSVIQRIISPKGESPCSKDRDPAYSTTNLRSNISATSSTGVSQGVSISAPFCAIAPSPYVGITISSSNSSMTGQGTGLSSYSPRNGLWLNSTPSTMVSTPISSTSVIFSGSARPTPPPLNIGAGIGIGMVGTVAPTTRTPSNSISPHDMSSAGVSGHVTATNFQPTSYFPAHLAQPTSSPAAPTSATAISSVPQISLVSHTFTTISTTAAASATTSSSNIQGITQPTGANTITSTPHPFSAESLFQPSKNDQADLLRRELDSRFLDRSGLSVPPTPPSSTYLRQELHHHQHQHTHLHQHQQLLPAASVSTTAMPLHTGQTTPAQIFPPPLFKDIPKLTTVDPQFYRAGIGLPPGGYTSYSSAGLLHTGLGGATPFMPPNHLTAFAPKKTGRWNAMHVRIAWEIYYHQNKQSSDKTGCPTGGNNAIGNLSSTNASITASNLITGSGGSIIVSTASTINNVGTASAIGGGIVSAIGPTPSISIKSSTAIAMNTTQQHLPQRTNELPPPAAFANALPGRSSFETSPLAASFIGAPPSHIGTAVSPFGRYVAPFGFTGLTHFGGHIDAWRSNAIQRSVAYHSSPASAPSWPIKSDPALDNARREAEERERESREREQRERDRQRREREERERKEKEDKLKREQLERERERERERDRKERERREMERREMERERMLQQQRINESNKQAAAAQAAAAVPAPARDRSPHRNVGELTSEIRIKEEHTRTKEEQDIMLMRASAAVAVVGDPRYHPNSLAAVQANAAAVHHHHANFIVAGRHGLPSPSSHLSRTMMPPTLSVGGPISHFATPGPPGWGIDPYRDPYPILRYNPIMEAALRHEAEERQKAMNIYAAQSAAHLRGKEPSPIPPPSVGALGPPSSHHRSQASSLAAVVAQTDSQPPLHNLQQTPLSQLSTGIVAGKTTGPSTPIVIPVQHMISVDSLSHATVNTKKESDHTMGIVVSAAGVGLSTVPAGLMGISPTYQHKT
ncbi:serine-rich adhesin for platelets [Drosophila obscura]|uniref:serine-rich adhesin for platelets n=1 Tax=Drosophila obscura TaxID=7282 RepID=UPI001BB15CFF|nr:serine-rich adhesin for platelets [Drosophila obscura]XP_041451835.1 serine-rich adhesin for platelets [Drosophila obscura]XP_041451836.1 serine-rich adhesin for platelets [Drosophila obscura]XP_041451837.1 serine-rich adhesin for platelets [Drosophila obscura]XP_041451838.1 serine-rich adhesin for platelets [Drosophila obscura]XP_041451839.1 serine-rich adhesin for platelets [Drosophila obscura]